MAENSDAQIEDLTDAVDVVADASDYPFRTERTVDDAVISSLDGRPDLLETTRGLMSEARAASMPGAAAPSASPSSNSGSPNPSASGNAARSGPTPQLVVRSPGGTMETRRAVDSPRFLVGRENCDLELSDRFVERWHVQLFERDGALVLQDLGSRNGVYLRIADDLALEDGDQLIIGEQRFEFRTSWDEPDKRRPGDPDALGASWAGNPVRLIRLMEGDQVGGVYPLGQRVTLGAHGADLSFPEDSLLGSPHAVVRRDQERYLLRDLDSDNGTFIRIADAVELIDGDCFMVGRTRIRLTFS